MIKPDNPNSEFELGGINHVALVCSDMERTVDFYSRVLGMEVNVNGPLSLRWDATSLRDLRDYDGADSVAQAARREQGRLLGTDIGLERFLKDWEKAQAAAGQRA